LGDPFASNLEAFPWLKLQISIREGRGGKREEGGLSRFWMGINAGE
jgi:hypothetical protein